MRLPGLHESLRGFDEMLARFHRWLSSALVRKHSRAVHIVSGRARDDMRHGVQEG